MTKVVHAEQWEKFLARVVGAERFGLRQRRGAVPALEAVSIRRAVGVEEIDVGMSHAGA